MRPTTARLPGAAGAPRWPLMPLLALRAHQEERDLRELGHALAETRSAEVEVAARWAALAADAAAKLAELAGSAAEFARAERFAAKLRAELADGARRAARARAAAEEACARYARSRGAREGLEEQRERWALRRRRAREAALERDLEDVLVSAQPSPGARAAAATRAVSAR